MPSTRGRKKAEEMEAALRTFFSSPRFAVAGASSDPTKFGNKGRPTPPVAVFAWYLQHSLPVTALNPRTPTVTVLSQEHQTVASPSQLPDPSSYSMSVITPPSVTKQLLKEAREAGVSAVWLQPGSFDADVLDYARREFKATIAGEGGGGHEGWCVLVDGENGLKLASKL